MKNDINFVRIECINTSKNGKKINIFDADVTHDLVSINFYYGEMKLNSEEFKDILKKNHAQYIIGRMYFITSLDFLGQNARHGVLFDTVKLVGKKLSVKPDHLQQQCTIVQIDFYPNEEDFDLNNCKIRFDLKPLETIEIRIFKKEEEAYNSNMSIDISDEQYKDITEILRDRMFVKRIDLHPANVKAIIKCVLNKTYLKIDDPEGFYMVYVEGSHNSPKYKHASLSDATIEADRLCVKEKKDAYVLKAIKKVSLLEQTETINFK